MKVRNGFVSNSSSSSFIIMKKDEEKLTAEDLMEVFEISEKSPLYELVKSYAKELASGDVCDPDELKSDYMWSDATDEEFEEDSPYMYKYYKMCKENGWKMYSGYVDSCDNPDLCTISIDFENDKLIINKEGGY